MKARFVIGYVLLALGILGSTYTASGFIRLIFAPPTGDIIAGLGAGLAWASYLAFSILVHNSRCDPGQKARIIC
jgi:hypothetical protein